MCFCSGESESEGEDADKGRPARDPVAVVQEVILCLEKQKKNRREWGKLPPSYQARCDNVLAYLHHLLRGKLPRDAALEVAKNHPRCVVREKFSVSVPPLSMFSVFCSHVRALRPNLLLCLLRCSPTRDYCTGIGMGTRRGRGL